jgi:hypothetical protein
VTHNWNLEQDGALDVLVEENDILSIVTAMLSLYHQTRNCHSMEFGRARKATTEV